VREHPEKFQVFLPVAHERFPITGVFTGFLTVGLWYFPGRDWGFGRRAW